jgi:hypothetical protein
MRAGDSSKTICSVDKIGWIDVPSNISRGKCTEDYLYGIIKNNAPFERRFILEWDKFIEFLKEEGIISESEKTSVPIRCLPPPVVVDRDDRFKCCECHNVANKNCIKQELWLFCHTCKINTLWKRTTDPVKEVIQKNYGHFDFKARPKC